MQVSSVAVELFCLCLLSAPKPPVEIVIEEDPTAAALPAAAAPIANPAPAEPQRIAEPPGQRLQQDAVIRSLQVQAALCEGRKLVAAGRFEEAIAGLEPHLASADGSEAFLETLAAAYRGQFAVCLREKNVEQAKQLTDRLRILAPSSLSEKPGGAADPRTSDRVVPKQELTNEHWVAEPAALAPAAAKVNPATPTIEKPAPEPAAAAPPEPLRQAERSYAEKRYAEALPYYEKAYEADPLAVQAVRERWGYCLLYVCYERCNAWLARPTGSIAAGQWDGLIKDLDQSCALAPSLKQYRDEAVEAIAAHRRSEEAARSVAQAPPSTRPNLYNSLATGSTFLPGQATVPGTIGAPAARSLPGQAAVGGWTVLETQNFRIFHRNASLAQQVAPLAEQARRMAHEKWFGAEPLEDWNPKCDLYLHPTGQDYSLATGVGAQSPGHSKVATGPGGVVSRRLEVRTDDPNMQSAVLPHEITHVVVAGRFGSATLPRWADEGMAVLTEPRDKQEAHLANLVASRQNGSRFTCRTVMTMPEYPPGPEMREFYAHSVGVCRFLVEHRGAQKLTQFLRLALQSNNYELALRQVYGFASFDAFEESFTRFLAGLPASSTTVAGAVLR